MYADNIAMMESQGKPVPQEWRDKLADVRDKLNGKTPEGGFASKEVFGHPLHSTGKYSDLVPIRIAASEQSNRSLERRMQEASNHVSALGEKIGRATAIANGKMKSSKAELKAAKAYLSSHDGINDAADLESLRKETIPELYRLRKLIGG